MQAGQCLSRRRRNPIRHDQTPVRSPPGKHEYLDLTPADFPVKAQLGFFREFCAEHQQYDFAYACG